MYLIAFVGDGMNNNIFLKNQKEPSLEDYMNFEPEGRGDLGGEIPVVMYRLLQYSMKAQLRESLGSQMQVELFQKAGFQAGCFFAKKMLDLSLPFDRFIASLQRKLEDYKIGLLRIESVDPQDGTIMLTVAEDVGCSGLPVLGEVVCNYDEGFISGILSSYMRKPYRAVEVDCWATGDRVCRFRAQVEETGHE